MVGGEVGLHHDRRPGALGGIGGDRLDRRELVADDADPPGGDAAAGSGRTGPGQERRGHQLPFRTAFHRPQGSLAEVEAERARQGAGHFVRIGDGPYSLTGGWPSVWALHRGGGFCGLPPTDRPIRMRVMDFYLHDEGLIRENWVPIDLLDVLCQMGLDPLARMREVLRLPAAG